VVGKTEQLMSRYLLVAVVALLTATIAPTGGSAESVQAKPRHYRHWHGYGFLPGYRPPEQIEWELNHRTRNWYGAPIYWYGGPGYYRGRWNGGGFGPCWTPTPIGPFWNCG
jgi:hypothetical protein